MTLRTALTVLAIIAAIIIGVAGTIETYRLGMSRGQTLCEGEKE